MTEGWSQFLFQIRILLEQNSLLLLLQNVLKYGPVES